MKISNNDIPLFLLVIIPILQSFVSKFSFSNQIPYFKNIDELALLFMLKFAITGLKNIFSIRQWRIILFFFFGYIFFGLISSYLNNVPLKQVIFQLVISSKLIYILCIVIGLENACSFYKNYLIIGKFILIISLILILWQFAYPSSYNIIFANGMHRGNFLFESGVHFPRGAGIFTHPGQLAVFTVSLVIPLLFLNTGEYKKLIPNYKIWIFISLTTLMLTFSRLEITSIIIAYSIIFIITSKPKNKILTFYTIIILIGFLTLLSSQYIFFIIHQYAKAGGFLQSNDPRIVFLLKGISIANDYFPFGSGLGTYGGFVAALFHSTIYLHYGFQNYYWFRQGHFLADTFWPHILGETGYFGLLSYFLVFITIIKISIQYSQNGNDTTNIGKIVAVLIIFLSLNSLATPDMVSVLSLSQFFTPIGCLFYLQTISR